MLSFLIIGTTPTLAQTVQDYTIQFQVYVTTGSLSHHSVNFFIFSTSSSPTASEVRKRTRDDQNEDRFKKDGKIHSFKQSDNDDDENNTWNGNSTQQM